MDIQNGVYEATKTMAMVNFLKEQGFQEHTINLLNEENLLKLAKDYGWNE